MMRPIASLALMVASLVVTPAFAQSTSDPVSTATFPVTGEVPDLCILGDPRIDGSNASINIASINGRVIRIDTLTDPISLTTRGTEANLAFDAVCNHAYSVSIESRNNGLWRQSVDAPVPAGFANAVPYLASIAWNEKAAELDADARTRSPKAAGFTSLVANSGTLSLKLRILPGTTNIPANAPLLAGDYGDIITVTLGPQ
ncbi:hypothetical protein [Sphingobium limneticum]|uniref:Spore coat protein U domain-containing protein n=1 Tax=Sphingobium limneticum TaxID=1007511 RepID=A0A5J5HWS4_9SPHN|nr:hypothetical protein [Sphingobium limneticum]KAA9014342.1 hypothetical protein F4U96_16955 [Sphingobium limneticum]KAA9027431.1 hypothetical protein F4U95_17080 [Sphingobium limneticum]